MKCDAEIGPLKLEDTMLIYGALGNFSLSGFELVLTRYVSTYIITYYLPSGNSLCNYTYLIEILRRNANYLKDECWNSVVVSKIMYSLFSAEINFMKLWDWLLVCENMRLLSVKDIFFHKFNLDSKFEIMPNVIMRWCLANMYEYFLS